MKLSELVKRCAGADPELVVDDGRGVPRVVTTADMGVMLVGGVRGVYVLLEPACDDALCVDRACRDGWADHDAP